MRGSAPFGGLLPDRVVAPPQASRADIALLTFKRVPYRLAIAASQQHAKENLQGLILSCGAREFATAN